MSASTWHARNGPGCRAKNDSHRRVLQNWTGGAWDSYGRGKHGKLVRDPWNKRFLRPCTDPFSSAASPMPHLRREPGSQHHPNNAHSLHGLLQFSYGACLNEDILQGRLQFILLRKKEKHVRQAKEVKQERTPRSKHDPRQREGGVRGHRWTRDVAWPAITISITSMYTKPRRGTT